MDTVKSVNGVTIRLIAERWFHIIETHNDMAGYYDAALETVSDPERIFEGKHGALIAIRSHSPGKHFVVVYMETDQTDGFVITAFLTKRTRQLEKRNLLWQRP